MKANKILYYILIILSVLLFIISISLLNNTKIMAPLVMISGIYFFLSAIIKLCKTNNKLKNTILCALDLLFWLS